MFYDPILAKLIVWGSDREEARKRMIQALRNNVILGVKTSIPYLVRILEHEDFIAGKTFTDFIEKNMNSPVELSNEDGMMALSVAAASFKNKKSSIKHISSENVLQSPWLDIGSWEIGLKK